MKVFILAPGPSATQEIADKIKESGHLLIVVTSAFDLAPWANYIVAGDRQWWIKNPQALKAEGVKYCAHQTEGTKRFTCGPGINSGVLSLYLAKKLGFKEAYLFGFDMHGTHYFGPYKNGLSNTAEPRRRVHLAQYKRFASSNKELKVYNCTPNSAIKYFEVYDGCPI